MTFAAALGWSLLRALIVTLLAWPCCYGILEWLNRDESPRRAWRIAAIVIPFLYPELLVGYAYGWLVAGLPLRAECACALLMWLRILPVGVVALWLTPASSVTASAFHCRKLSLRTWSDRCDWLRLWLLGPVIRALPSGILMLLVTFQQFELAALLKAVSWTDWLFVQQVGGLTLEASLRVMWLPVVGQVVLLLFALACATAVLRNRSESTLERTLPSHDRVAVGLIVASWVVGVIVPTLGLCWGLSGGFAQLLTQRLRLAGLARELIGGLSISTIAALVAYTACGFAIRSRANCETASGVILTGLLIAPGLLGSLILGLTLVALFQWPGFSWAYGTPLVWVVGLTLFLIPRSLLLRLWLERSATPAEFVAEHLVASRDPHRRTAGRDIRWRMVEQPRFLAVAALVYWGYLDLTMAYLLAPAGMPSGVVRLYNFMHFGRTAALSAEAVVLLVGPFLIAALVWRIWRGICT